MPRQSCRAFYHLLEGRHGQLRIMRFWSKVAIGAPDECWDWQASRNHHGYGRFKIEPYQTVHSNRMSWAIQNKADPGDLMVLHSCDRPECCNPHHLRLGTPLDNVRDMHDRARWRSADQAGANNGAAKIDETVLAEIISKFREGWNNKQIAATVPVGHALISRIRTGRSWQKQAAALGWEPSPQFARKQAA